MAHTEEMLIHGVMTPVTVFDSPAQDIDDAAAAAKFNHRNLLDNWYFADPIDQRGGYVVPPEKDYFDAATGNTQIGVTDAYYTVIRRNEWGVGYIVIGGTEYAVAPENVVRGYTGEGYTIDRWRGNGTVVLADGCIRVSGTVFSQAIEPSRIVDGAMHTFSFLAGDHLYTASAALSKSVVDTWQIDHWDGNVFMGVQMLNGVFHAAINANNSPIDLIAAKLELGTQQTLAHQDENGNWVLNDPPPNKATELAKCQRYFVNLNPNHGGYFTVGSGFILNETAAELVVPIPVTMRANPTIAKNNFYITQAGGARPAIEAVAVYNSGSGSVNLHCTISGGIAAAPCFAYGAPEHSIWLDANL